MAKKGFTAPMITLPAMGGGGGGQIVGPGSGQGTLDPCTWGDWYMMDEGRDFDNNGIPDEWNDYVQWWKNNGWSEDMFIQYNGVGFDGPEPPL